MKMTVTVLFMVVSMVLNTGHAQSTQTPERKYYYLNKAEEDIFNLPFPQDTIVDFIYPEILAERNILAPNYPIYPLNVTEEAKKTAFFAWLAAHPDEFDPYYAYVASYIRINQAH